MLILRVVTRRHLSCVKNIYLPTRHLATQAKAKTDLMTDFKQKLPAAQPKKKKRAPFVKNLFLGQFDHEFLTYPEPQHVDRYNEFEEWLQPFQEYVKTLNPNEFENTNTIPPHVLQKLRELGIMGTRIHEDYGGMNLLNSEFMRVLETASIIPALGLFLLKQSVPPIDIFNKYGTVEQKLKYLPKIASGQSIATIAITEDASGPAVKSFESTATLSNDDKYWLLDGSKDFVANSNISNVFIVFAHGMQSGDLEKRPETITSFIVDADTPGLTIVKDPIQTVGLKGFNTGKIIMKDVKIPKENILGEVGSGSEQYVELFSNGRHYIAAIAITVLKNFLNLLIKDCLHRKHFDKMLYQIDAAQQIFKNITCSIYAMESVLYLTTATMDIYEDQDLLIETAITEQFCVQECLHRIEDSMGLIGPRACTLIHPFERILRDSFTVTNYETSLIDTKIYSALLGLQHYGLNMREVIKKERNILLNPKLAFQKLLTYKPNSLKLHLEEYLHPSLQECAQFCDRGIFKLKQSTEDMLIRDGINVGDNHANLMKLSDMVSLIYVYIAMMGRASRSYCIGNRDSENEIAMCMIMAYKLQNDINRLHQEIRESEYATGDCNAKMLSDVTFQRKSYIAAHPLQRNY